MSEPVSNGHAAPQANANTPSFGLQRAYLKDLSLELPNAPQIFLEQEAPKVEISIAIGGQRLADTVFEATVTATITTRIDHIRHIRVGLNHQAYEAVCTPVDIRKAPKTVVQAQFSIPWTLAAALTDGAVGLEHFTQAMLDRTDLLSLANKVEAYVDADIERDSARHVSPVLLEITLDDGSIHRLRVDTPLGHPNHPMSAENFDVKARDCLHLAARTLGDDTSTRLRLHIEHMEELRDVRELIHVLAPEPPPQEQQGSKQHLREATP